MKLNHAVMFSFGKIIDRFRPLRSKLMEQFISPYIYFKNRPAQRERERERERERDRERERQTDRQTDNQTDRENLFITNCVPLL